MSGWTGDLPGLVTLAAITCLAAAVNSVAGGGTILTFPVLVAILPPDPSRMVVANATSTIGLWPGALAAAWAYRGEREGQPPWARWLVLPSVAGAIAGAMLVLMLPPETIRVAVPWLILLAAVLFAAQPWLVRPRRPSSAERAPVRPQSILSPQSGDRPLACPESIGMDGHIRQTGGPSPLSAGPLRGDGRLAACVLQFFVALYGGYFGAGIGILMLAMLGLLGLGDIHRLNGVKNVLGMVVNGAAAGLFIFGSLLGGHDVAWPHAAVMAVAAVIGGLGGSLLARRMPAASVRRIVAIIGFALAGYYFAT